MTLVVYGVMVPGLRVNFSSVCESDDDTVWVPGKITKDGNKCGLECAALCLYIFQSESVLRWTIFTAVSI